MTNYGLPLRFKGIKKTTGEMIVLCTLLSSVQHDESLVDVANVEFFQSTGHHDKNGTEIFFGDVVLCSCSCSEPNVMFKVIMLNGKIELKQLDSNRNSTSHMLHKITHVLGNIHTPLGVLKAKAQEVLIDG